MGDVRVDSMTCNNQNLQHKSSKYDGINKKQAPCNRRKSMLTALSAYPNATVALDVRPTGKSATVACILGSQLRTTRSGCPLEHPSQQANEGVPSCFGHSLHCNGCCSQSDTATQHMAIVRRLCPQTHQSTSPLRCIPCLRVH